MPLYDLITSLLEALSLSNKSHTNVKNHSYRTGIDQKMDQAPSQLVQRVIVRTAGYIDVIISIKTGCVLRNKLQ